MFQLGQHLTRLWDALRIKSAKHLAVINLCIARAVLRKRANDSDTFCENGKLHLLCVLSAVPRGLLERPQAQQVGKSGPVFIKRSIGLWLGLILSASISVGAL